MPACSKGQSGHLTTGSLHHSRDSSASRNVSTAPPGPEQAGSLLELTQGGRQPITLSNGETRGYLEDGDTIVMKAFCQRGGYRRIGLGECRGTVLAARRL